MSTHNDDDGLPAARLSWRCRPCLHLALIALVALSAYSNSFEASFHFDDARNIIANPLIRDFTAFLLPADAASHPYFGDFKMRIVGYFTFAVNYRLHDLHVGGFHAVNLLVHILGGALVYLLAATIFMTPKMRRGGTSIDGQRLLALFCALLFVAHPLQTQAVTYIVQRFASLAAMFSLAAMLCYLKSRLLSTQRPFTAAGLYLLGLVAIVLALKTKESTFTFPLALALGEAMFLDRASGSGRRRLLLLLPFLLAPAIIPLSVMDFDLSLQSMQRLQASSRTLTDMPRTDYLLTEATVIPIYLRLLFFPAGQNFDYDLPIQTGLASPAVLRSLLLLVGLLLFAFWSLARSRRTDPRWRLVSFGILWFFVMLLNESSFIPIVDVIYEHRVYLPSVGAFLAIASVLFILADRLRGAGLLPQRAALAFCSIVVLALSSATYMRNRVWRDEVTLWEDTALKSPNKARVRNTLGTAYLESGRTDEAIAEFEATLRIDPGYWAAAANLGSCFMVKAAGILNDEGSHQQAGRLTARAIEFYEQALALKPDDAMVLSLLDAARERNAALRRQDALDR